MIKKTDPGSYLHAKHLTLENLLEIQTSLITCIDEGKIDQEDSLNTRVLDLIKDVGAVNHWDQLDEFIDQAKILEQDIAVWLSMHGRTSYSLHWPVRPIL